MHFLAGGGVGQRHGALFAFGRPVLGTVALEGALGHHDAPAGQQVAHLGHGEAFAHELGHQVVVGFEGCPGQAVATGAPGAHRRGHLGDQLVGELAEPPGPGGPVGFCGVDVAPGGLAVDPGPGAHAPQAVVGRQPPA